MVYDITTLNASVTSLEYIVAANDLADKLPAQGGLIALFIIILSVATSYTNDFRKALLGASLACALFSLILRLAGLVSWYFPVLFAVGIVTGIVLLQDKDYG